MTNIDYSHLHSLENRLFNEKARLNISKTTEDASLRSVWVSQIESEIESERKLLGLKDDLASYKDCSDDELLYLLDL